MWYPVALIDGAARHLIAADDDDDCLKDDDAKSENRSRVQVKVESLLFTATVLCLYLFRF
jgi:hypothetical protein